MVRPPALPRRLLRVAAPLLQLLAKLRTETPAGERDGGTVRIGSARRAPQSPADLR